MSEPDHNDAEIHASYGKLDAANQEQASLILWKIWGSTRPHFQNPAACQEALNKDPHLFNALKAAHAAGKYGTIRNWGESTISIEEHIRNLLQDIEEPLTDIINGKTTLLPLWSPKDLPIQLDVQRHLGNLKIPTIKDRPNLLLHEWGSFKHDPTLKQRLDNVFMPNNHTFLVNTSGSGKTRLLLEGLCDKWGFYFTSTVDSTLLGSSDVQYSIQKDIPKAPQFRANLPPAGASNYQPALVCNRDIARKIFRQVLLSRLIIFHRFAEIMQRERTPQSRLDIYRERWLLLQLRPSLANISDIFYHLTYKLRHASDHFISMQTQDLLERIRVLCSKSTLEGTPMFCVLDEAQYAATEHTTSFRSDYNGSHRPILREIVRAWEEQISGRDVFLVIAGTGISKDVVDQAMASAIMKESRYRWCSDTGAFNKKEDQRRYLARYLPKALLESQAGERLLERLWYWLHGRYRFTTAYVTELIYSGFQQPHRLLNAFVKYFTGFSITDAPKYVEMEEEIRPPNFSQYKIDFSKLQRNSDMLSTIHRITTHYMMRSIVPHLGKDEAMYVEYGFARFDDSETRVVVIDEPLVLLAALEWMNKNHRVSYKLLSRDISTHDRTFNGFENYIVFCLDLIFWKERRLSDVFTFHGTAPSWADQEARIVSVYSPDSDHPEACAVCFSRLTASSVTSGMNAKSPELTMSWLKHRQRPPFCFPHQSMGPDVMFILQLSDGSHIWVALQTKWSLGEKGNLKLSKQLLLHAMKSVTPSHYFLDKNNSPFSPVSHPGLREGLYQSLLHLPGRRIDAGKYSLLRVVASFPAKTRMNRFIERDADEEGHPIATLNMDLVKNVTKRLTPQAFLEKYEIQAPLPSSRHKKENRKRKLPHEEETRSRRKKLKI